MSFGSTLLGAVLAAVSVTGAGAVSTAPPTPAVGGAHQVTASATAGRWAWPLDPGPQVVRRFDQPDQPWLPGHRGVDLAGSVGQPVLAPTDGRVSWSGVIAGRGVVVVSHDDGLRSTFEPVGGAPVVGTTVPRGGRVGEITGTAGHCAPRTCLHWGVLRGETYLDPLSFVGRARVILLPLP
ncbi:hypothetical protein GCM10009868_29190 [Terrabacter aerolatus]|uniref:M23ase beta-sheet core domain-containing protein n=1 Tax=Terrabacter aerolatus TaxID=422442 RepID=A0A512CXH0_9MICO|nr:M23 family metallopeptidase [Terrabacter aerolatus]GEO28906.1 hypothetical protein TAE01_07160 [Terrabacter aerolatus]